MTRALFPRRSSVFGLGSGVFHDIDVATPSPAHKHLGNAIAQASSIYSCSGVYYTCMRSQQLPPPSAASAKLIAGSIIEAAKFRAAIPRRSNGPRCSCTLGPRSQTFVSLEVFSPRRKSRPVAAKRENAGPLWPDRGERIVGPVQNKCACVPIYYICTQRSLAAYRAVGSARTPICSGSATGVAKGAVH